VRTSVTFNKSCIYLISIRTFLERSCSQSMPGPQTLVICSPLSQDITSTQNTTDQMTGSSKHSLHFSPVHGCHSGANMANLLVHTINCYNLSGKVSPFLHVTSHTLTLFRLAGLHLTKPPIMTCAYENINAENIEGGQQCKGVGFHRRAYQVQYYSAF
jgi:hypothetical protein